MSATRIGRAFSPENHWGNPTQAVGLGWYITGPLALGHQHFAPTAQPHTSLGHRPRYAARNSPRAKGPPHTSEGQRPSTGATPQELNRPTKQRAEGPVQRIVGYEVGRQFRGVTKMVTHGMDRAFSPRVDPCSDFLGRRPRLVSSRAFGPPSYARSAFLGRCPRNWHGFGPLALRNRQAPQGADVPASHASPPSSAPTAHLHTSLGQRPRIAAHKPHEG